jgi:homoserine dehydrogenase
MCKGMEVKFCLIGMGNVGTSFLKLLKEKRESVSDKFNINTKLVAIFEYDGALINSNGIDLDDLLRDYSNLRNNQYWKSNVKAQDLISTLDIDLCIETTPTKPDTGEPALTHILEALKNKIDVVSSNKAPFYLKYDIIKNLANKMNCLVKFEATVASCVPALSIKQNLIGNTITRIRAILNGTNNYILSRMTAEGVSFSVALKEAQELGYAETDPNLDINGYDTAGKLVILSNELLGWSKSIEDVSIKGISKITSHALELAKLDGYVIKHLAIAENNDLIVEPRLVRRDSPLNVQGTLNVIELQTKYAGSVIIMGKGAGGFEAGAAILNDLISITIERERIIKQKS